MNLKSHRRRANGSEIPFSTCLLGLSFVLLMLVASCGSMMEEQPKLEPYESSPFFPDGKADRHLEENTVARGTVLESEWINTGQIDGEPVATMPAPLTEELLTRGEQQYNIFCSPCHGMVGYGEGMIVQRGFPKPPSFHQEHLREAPDGHYFDVITNGFGVMYSYAYRVKPEDRWAIVAYIRALQLSQAAPEDILSEEDRQQLDENGEQE